MIAENKGENVVMVLDGFFSEGLAVLRPIVIAKPCQILRDLDARNSAQQQIFKMRAHDLQNVGVHGNRRRAVGAVTNAKRNQNFIYELTEGIIGLAPFLSSSSSGISSTNLDGRLRFVMP